MNRFVLAAALLASSSLVYAQNSHGSISGQVSDPTGAIIPKAHVTILDTDTGAITQVVTTKEGFYTAPDLQPGPYKVTVEAPGFRTLERTGINIATQQNATINLKLTVGETQQTIDVSSDAPMIDTADASTGQVLTNAEVEDLPSNGRNPLDFARLEYGAVPKAKHAISSATPYGQQTADDFSLGGGNSASNEILLNGVPNFQDSGRNAAYSPPLDSVNEVRVDVFGANAMYGDTSGGTVNVTTKNGTNQFHGSASWFYQAAGCSSQHGTWVSRDANACDPMAALPWTTIKLGGVVPPATHQNQVAATLGGPIWIPKVFNGRDKLFFFYAYEAVVGQQPPAQTIGTVPTQAERNGDFSALLALGSAYQLYNPYVTTGSQTNYTRAPIPGNILSNAGLSVNPITAAYLKYVPLPNYQGATTTADGQNNYFAFTPNLANYRSHTGRLDYNLGRRDKLWGEAHRSRYLTQASNYFHNASTGTITDQINSGGVVEEVHTFSPTLFLDVRGGLTRYDNTNSISSAGISPTSIGLPSYVAANSTALALPQFTFTDATNPLSFGNQPGAIENFDTIQLFANLTKIWGAHSIQVGTDLRAYKLSSLTPGAANGTFAFAKANGNPVALSQTAAPATFGSSFALLDLGIPTGGSYNVTPAFQYDSFLDAFFLQDDWKVSHNFNISVGARFEHETPVVESNNRMVNGFLPGAANEATAAATANFAASPGTVLPASAFQPTGGVTYSTPSNRHAYQPAPLYFSPRIGMTYAPDALHGKGVVRVGYGLYTNPFNDYNTGQTYGYAATTTYVQSSNNGLTNSSLNDPFPTATNPIQQPTGSAVGVNTNLGSKVVFYYPNVKVPYSERASLDVQYQIGNNTMIELGYINNHQVHLSYSNAVDDIPLLPYLSRSPYYNGPTTNFFTGSTYAGGGPATTNVPNPFKGVAGITGTLATASTLAPINYLLTNPEFTSVTEQLVPNSSSNYNALNARLYHKMSHGLSFNGVFEWSRLLGTFGQLNNGDVLNYQETTSDLPFHFAGYGTYQLPFGHGRAFLNHNPVIDRFVGGFQYSAVYQFSSGTPMSWGNVIYNGNWHDFQNKQHSANNVFGTPVFNTTVFDLRTNATSAAAQPNPYLPNYNPPIQPNAYNYRTFPQYLLRQDYTSNWDMTLQKNTRVSEGVLLELRLDVFNALNRPQYNTPNVSPTSSSFGTTPGVYSGANARQLQLGAHVTF